MFNKKKTHRCRDEPFCIFTYVYTAMSLATYSISRAPPPKVVLYTYHTVLFLSLIITFRLQK